MGILGFQEHGGQQSHQGADSRRDVQRVEHADLRAAGYRRQLGTVRENHAGPDQFPTANAAGTPAGLLSRVNVTSRSPPTLLSRKPSNVHMDSVWLDLKYAVRSVAGAPKFAAVVIATLALGIGANTAVFSVLNAAVLKPLPYDEPERLVRVYHSANDDNGYLTGI